MSDHYPEVEESGGVRTIRDKFKPNPKQAEFFQACADPHAEEIMYDGSIRAGKTQAACKQIVAWAWKHGGRYLVARKTYPELVDSTMKVMLSGEGGLPPACPHEIMRGGTLAEGYRAGERVLYLANGSEILFRNLESAEEGRAKLRNISLNGIFIDQVEELDGDEWGEFYEELLGRLSDPRGPRKVILAANPGPTDHWVYKRFIEEENRELYPWTRYIHCTLYDNQENLDPRYFESRVRTLRTNPEYYRRMVLGEWGAFGGKRFKTFEASKHIIEPFQIPGHWELMEAIDYGHAHPFCCLWVAIDEQERWYVVDEHYESERPISYHAKVIQGRRETLASTPAVTWMDPSAFAPNGQYESVAYELTDFAIYPARAQNDRIGGWARLEELLTDEVDDGRGGLAPRLRIFSSCKNLLRELPNARYKEGSDDIEKKNDHALDALRYAVMSRPPVPKRSEELDEYDRRSVYARKKLAEIQERQLTAIDYGG